MEILKKLIQINSVSGNEAEIQKYILSLLASYGHMPLLFEGNIVVEIKGQDNKKCIILNAHTDTVDPGNINQWTHNPFKPVEQDGKVYGLGASDNKASVAMLLILAKEFAVKKPKCSLIMTFTVGEEVDGHGTKFIAKVLKDKYLNNYTKVSAVVTEPANSTYFCVGHKGNIFLKITTKGMSGHGSSPVNSSQHSVLMMYKVIKKLENLGKIWQKKYKNKDLGSPSLGVATSISAGNPLSPNKFPDACHATFDIRTVPEMHSRAIDEIRKILPENCLVENVYEPVGYAYTQETEVIVKLMKSQGFPVKKFTGSSDMPFFTEIGIPAVIFGPGEPEVMHKPNEYCSVDNIVKGVEVLAKLISSYN